MHVKSGSEQDCGEAVSVGSGCDVFGSHSGTGRLLVLHQRERPAADEAQVDVGVALADAALVLTERRIEMPLRRVCDRPVDADRFPERLRGQLSAEQVITAFDLPVPVAKGPVDGYANGSKIPPA